MSGGAAGAWVRVGNAIDALAVAHPDCEAARELADDWSEFFSGAIRRTLQSAALTPVAFGACAYYWRRYQWAYADCDAGPEAPDPASVEPIWSAMAEATVLSTADDIADGLTSAADAVADGAVDAVRATAGAVLPLVLIAGAAWYYLRKR